MKLFTELFFWVCIANLMKKLKRAKLFARPMVQPSDGVFLRTVVFLTYWILLFICIYMTRQSTMSHYTAEGRPNPFYRVSEEGSRDTAEAPCSR